MDFNTQLYHSPKIDIIGKEVPLAAMEKTGDILQGRYDAAKDTETKTMALTKKLASSSNPVDRETAAQIMEHYGNKMKERAAVGDYQNMKWQTQQDAMDAAGLYEGLSNRNKELMKHAEDIDTKSGITDVNRRAYEKDKWLKSQSQTMFNPETGVLEGVNVKAPSLYKDVDMSKFTDSFGQGIIANIVGKTNKGEKVFQKGETLPNGQIAPGITVYDIASGRQRASVTPGRVREVVEGYAKGSPEVAAYLNGVEDYYENSLGMSKQEAQKQAYNDVIEKAVQPAISKYAHSSDIQNNSQELNVQATGLFGAGQGTPLYPNNVVINSLPSDNLAGSGEVEMRKAVNKTLNGNVEELNRLNSYTNNMISMAKNTNNKQMEDKYKDLRSVLKEINNLPRDKKIRLESYMSYGLLNNEDVKLDKLPADLHPIAEKLVKYTNTNLDDTNTEDSYTEWAKTGKSLKQNNIIQPDVAADGQVKNLTQINGLFAKQNFSPYGTDEIDDKKNYKIVGMTEVPLGNGIGHVYQAVDQDQNPILLTAKDDRYTRQMDNAFQHASRTNQYKDITDFSENEQKTIKEVLKDANLSVPKGHEAEANHNIEYKNGVYIHKDQKGNVLGTSNNLIGLIDKTIRY